MKNSKFENPNEVEERKNVPLGSTSGQHEVRRYSILLIADTPNWIFHRHALMLQKYLHEDFNIEIMFRQQEYDEDKYDLIYPFEFDLIPTAQIKNPSKYVTGIRSHVTWANHDFLSFIAHLRKNFHRVHVVSKRLFDLFSPFMPEIKYVSHGVETQRFVPQTASDQSGKNLILGWAGNRNQVLKGFKEFIEPLNSIPGVTLKICGYADKYFTLDEMPGFYDTLDAYICASIQEGNNNSLLEAALMERAIITTDNGTVPEYLVNNESALIVHRSLDSISAAVIKLRDDPELRVRLGKNARQAVLSGGWDWAIKAQDYKRFFLEAINSSDQDRIQNSKNIATYEENPHASLNVLLSQWNVQRELIKGLQERLSFLDRPAEEARKYVEELEISRDRLVEDNKSLKKYIEDLEAAREHLEKDIESQKVYINELEAARDQLLVELENQKQAIQALEAQSKQLQSNLEEAANRTISSRVKQIFTRK